MKEVNLAIMLTTHCNLQCYHCFRSDITSKPNFSSLKLDKLLIKINNSPVKNVRFTGGEPFIIPHLEKKISYLSTIGVNTSIVTNGTLLTSKKIKALKHRGIGSLGFSVFSADSERHDLLSRKKGSFNKMKSSLLASIDAGISTFVDISLSWDNLDHIDNTLHWLESIGVEKIKILRLSPLGRASINSGFKHINQMQWDQIIMDLKSRKFNNKSIYITGGTPKIDDIASNQSACSIFPFLNINIDVSGFIYPCCILNGRKEYSIGHVDELIENDFQDALLKIEKRAIKHNLINDSDNLPCIDIYNSDDLLSKTVCPLYSKNL